MMRPALKSAVCVVIVTLAVSPGGSQTRSMQPDGARDCAMCHLDWVESFDRRDALVLIDKPPPGVVADEATCLGCHDGSVDDSRTGVWRHHGHHSGTVVPPDMTVPEELPLEEGRLTCRTCHSAHTGESETLESIDFVRLSPEGGRLCTMCHADYGESTVHSSHPLVALPWDLPVELRDDGARAGEDNRTMSCETCHMPHGKADNDLLVTSDVGRLCIACHEKLDPDHYSNGAMSRFHPVSVSRTDETPDCLSCHQMHRSPAPDHLLNKPLADGGLCIGCHAEQQAVVGTRHDLLKTMPTTHNDLGIAAREGGTCSQCHAIHGQARTPNGTDIDPSGQCATCHTAGRCAEPLALSEHNHPFHLDADAIPAGNKLKLSRMDEDGQTRSLKCTSCHQPHGSSHVRFLRHRPDAICANCHSHHVSTVAGAHDIPSRHPDAKNTSGLRASDVGKCGFCHAVHGANVPLLWAVSSEPVDHPSEACRQCHRSDGLAGEKIGGELRHPAGPVTADSKAAHAGLPLFEHAGQAGLMTCGTCHDVHADSTQRHELLRGENGEAGQGWCGQCHLQANSIALSLHGDRFLEAHAADGPRSRTSCGPCHAVHAPPDTLETDTWSAPSAKDVEVPGSERCIGCHSEDGGAPAVHVTIHPLVSMRSAGSKQDRGFMPLIDHDGRVGNQGAITCLTCHVPHGRVDNAALPELRPDEVSEQQLAGLKTILRPFVTPNLCSGCHGLEGLAYYMYFHHPEKLRQMKR